MTACKAAESYSLTEALARLPMAEAHVRTLLQRLRLLRPLPADAEVLDVGAAQGRFVIACAKTGLRAAGVEPCTEALQVASLLADHEGVKIRIVPGVAEALPFASGSFDLVHAMSVIEHVRDAQAAFDEACRVLRPGGLFWFYTTSSLCPRQDEIRGFPCFGWYPDRLKRRIMAWAAANRPHLVGHTQTPAINWFTPWKARRMLSRAGFTRVYDRWDIPCPPQMPWLKRLILGLIRAIPGARLLAGVMTPGCAYAAMR